MEVADTFDEVDESFLRTAIIGSKRLAYEYKGIGEWSAHLELHLELIRSLGRRKELAEHDQSFLIVLENSTVLRPQRSS